MVFIHNWVQLVRLEFRPVVWFRLSDLDRQFTPVLVFRRGHASPVPMIAPGPEVRKCFIYAKFSNREVVTNYIVTKRYSATSMNSAEKRCREESKKYKKRRNRKIRKTIKIHDSISKTSVAIKPKRLNYEKTVDWNSIFPEMSVITTK